MTSQRRCTSGARIEMKRTLLVFVLITLLVFGQGGGVVYPPAAVNSTTLSGFFSNGLNMPFGSAAGVAFVGSANEVRFVKFTLSATWSISKVCTSISTGVAAQTVSFGIYNSTGGTKLIDSGLVSAATSSSAPCATFTAVVLTPGEYIFAWTCTSTSVTQASMNGLSAGLANTFNADAPRVGTAANAATVGALPSTLGVLTGAAQNIAAVFWETQ